MVDVLKLWDVRECWPYERDARPGSVPPGAVLPRVRHYGHLLKSWTGPAGIKSALMSFA